MIYKTTMIFYNVQHFVSVIGVKLLNIYYINTNEIPGEFLCKTKISSHAKITPYMYLHTEKITGAIATL